MIVSLTASKIDFSRLWVIVSEALIAVILRVLDEASVENSKQKKSE